MIRSIREFVRRRTLSFIGRMLNTDEGRGMVSTALDHHVERSSSTLNPEWAPTPYDEFSSEFAEPQNPAIFVSGRFRSGSTLVWNIFRQFPSCTAYYEPFNEQRWFTPQDESAVDQTHVNVSEYWREYVGLEELAKFYNEGWGRRGLCMGPHAFDSSMRRYIDLLISHASARSVLQFNRADFRLPWLRAQYPNARFIHVYRHPRDQWCSTLAHDEFFGPNDGTLREFRRSDGFYLGAWVRDLQNSFPILKDAWDEHPYVAFYYIWKLSFSFGRAYADRSLAMEDLIDDPKRVLVPLFEYCGLDDVPWESILGIINVPQFGKWREYAPADWFRDIEQRCDQNLRLVANSQLMLPGLENHVANS